MKIKGIPVGTTTPRPDWNQDNPQRADYIKNKPTSDKTLAVPGMFADAKETGEKIATATRNLERKIAAVSDAVAGIGFTATDDGTGVVTLQFSSEGGGGNSGGGGGGEGGSAVSPTIEITEIEGGHTVTVTDVYGSQSFDVMDGEKGEKGEPGPAGADGEPYELTAEDEAKLVAAMLAADEIAQMRQDLEEIRADLDYKAIDITNFGCSAAGMHELGSAVTGMSCYWSLNKEPAKQTLRSETLDNSVRSKQYTGLNITSNTTVTLSVTDERGATDSASSSISFLNGVYHGVIADGAAVNNAAVLALTRILQGSRGITFTANAGAGQRIAYAIPSRYGTPVFTVGGFEGGFSKAATISFINASGYTENYDVWLSDNVALGSTTVKVS
jgi:hypothetical protein